MSSKKFIVIMAALAVVEFSCGGDDNGTGPGPADTVSPAAVDDLTAGDPTDNSLVLSWTAPGDDDITGTAATYDIRYSTASITAADWDSATQVSGEPDPEPAGSSESFTVSGLGSNTTYYFALKTADEASNQSAISNIADGKTLRGTTDSWEVTFGGAGDDVARSVAATADGGQVVAGWTESSGAGGADVYLLRTDAAGNMIWETTFGGAQDDKAEAVALTADGYIISGYTNSFGAGGQDIYVIRTNASGDSIWTRTFGTVEDDLGMSVAVADDGGFVIAGSRQYPGGGDWDMFVIKVDVAGDSVWAHNFGGLNDDYGEEIKLSADGGFIIAGRTKPTETTGDVYLVKLNASGEADWEKTISESKDDGGWGLALADDEGYLVAGHTYYPINLWQNLLLLKVGPSGNEVWDEPTSLGGSNKPDIGYAVVPAGDGGYVVAGTTSIEKENENKLLKNVYLVKTNMLGFALWQRTIGGAEDDQGYCVTRTDDGGFVIAGSTRSFGAGGEDIYLIKTDANGQL